MPMDSQFDEYAANYEAALGQGLSLAGEDMAYFARGRVAWLAHALRVLGEHPKRVMDYGCGQGSTTPLFFDLLGAEFVLGTESSEKLVDLARRTYGSKRAYFSFVDQYVPDAGMDLTYSNGVFHHIPVRQRGAAIDYVWRSLRPGGLFALWENNPWNPGTRLVMSRIPFDRDAIPLSSRQAQRLLREGGFEVLRTDYLFIFPRQLKCFRRLETLLSRVPLGGQFQVLCRKP